MPINIEDAKVKPLPSLVNSDLQKRLEKELMSNPNWKSLMNNNKMAVGIVDLSNPENAKYASINGDYMMYAASLPKIAVLLSSMDAIEKGSLRKPRK